MTCSLKRCQGKRGCICPKGVNLPSGSFSGALPARPPRAVTLPVLPVNGKAPKNKSKRKATPSAVALGALPEARPLASPTADPTPSTLPPLEEPDPRGNGKVVVRYNHYKKEFVIAGGSTTAAAIDAQYFLLAVFPSARLHLSRFGPSDFGYEADGLAERPMLPEEPMGVYHGLQDGDVYWVHVEEDSAERAAYEERQAAYAKTMASQRLAAATTGSIIKEKTESCSCVEGNPCVDRYCCRDWDHRFEVAKKHGWKGFQ
ncbi:hypothetical protein ACHHYP_13714 [Achlya hypogyna]|uniref:Uncharacterized protein n=1 Tax=Achlya hypogyna TaxID=1202772 RepID=A0A1V9YEP1_ACHHY|nr:hypothetical protein ACHHYP_13714 [Achlya hypogyna]